MIKGITIVLIYVLLSSCSGEYPSKGDDKYVRVIKAAEKFAEENCQSFHFDPDEAYMTISRYDNYRIFKNHYLFEVEKKLLDSEISDNTMGYLSSDTYFEYKFGWLKKEYSQKSFWVISSMPQLKNPKIILGNSNYEMFFIDDGKVEGIKNPRMMEGRVCDPEKYKKLKSKLRVERDDRSMFFDAVIDNDLEKVDKLLKKGVEIHDSDQDQFFSWAIYNCNRDMVLKLLDKYRMSSFQIRQSIYCRDSVLIEKILMKVGKFEDEHYVGFVNEALMLVEHDIVRVLVKYWSDEKFGSDSLQYYLSILANDKIAIEKYISNPKFGVNYDFEVSRDYLDKPIIESPFWLALKNRNAELAIYFVNKGANLGFTDDKKIDRFLTFVFFNGLFTEQELKRLIEAIQKSGVSTEKWALDYRWDYFHSQFQGSLKAIRESFSRPVSD